MKQQATIKSKSTAATRIAKVERGRSAAIWAAGLSVALAIVIPAIFLWSGIRTPSAPTNEAASAADTDRAASIVVHHGTRSCERKIFDNETGRISDATTPCDEEVVLDANGVPLPLGTARTMRSISKSFKSE